MDKFVVDKFDKQNKGYKMSSGKHIMPILVILVPTVILAILYFFLRFIIWGWFIQGVLVSLFYQDFVVDTVFGTTTGTSVFLGVLFSAIIYAIYAIAHQTEGWRMTRDCVKAKKEKVCPIIRFE